MPNGSQKYCTLYLLDNLDSITSRLYFHGIFLQIFYHSESRWQFLHGDTNTLVRADIVRDLIGRFGLHHNRSPRIGLRAVPKLSFFQSWNYSPSLILWKDIDRSS